MVRGMHYDFKWCTCKVARHAGIAVKGHIASYACTYLACGDVDTRASSLAVVTQMST